MNFIDLQAQYKVLQPQIEKSINNVLEHGQFIMGPEVLQLEKEIGEFIGVKHVITCANGTDALQMLYMAYGVTAGDAVFCPDITFIASVEPACMLGAAPVFCDVEKDSFNLCPESLERQILAVRKEGKLNPKIVVAVDFLGNGADYERIDTVCKKYDLILVEDAAQSFGAHRDGRRCGSFGHASITSFFPAKPLGCYGDGGAIMTDDDRIAGLCRSIGVHGKGESKYSNVRIGINSRLDTIQAAILLVKLKALKEYEIQARQKITQAYNDAFEDKFQLLKVRENDLSVYAQYAFLLKNEEERDKMVNKLKKKDIPTMVYYPLPQHKMPIFEQINTYNESFVNSKDYCSRTLSLPMHPYLNQETQNRIIQTVLEVMDDE